MTVGKNRCACEGVYLLSPTTRGYSLRGGVGRGEGRGGEEGGGNAQCGIAKLWLLHTILHLCTTIMNMNIIKCVTSKREVLEVDVGLVEASRGRVHEDSPVRLL